MYKLFSITPAVVAEHKLSKSSLSSFLTRVAGISGVGDCSSFGEVGAEVGAWAWAGVGAGAVVAGTGTGAGASAAGVGAAAVSGGVGGAAVRAGAWAAAAGEGVGDWGVGAWTEEVETDEGISGLSTLNKLIILWI